VLGETRDQGSGIADTAIRPRKREIPVKN
jgi:hypothetical protein